MQRLDIHDNINMNFIGCILNIVIEALVYLTEKKNLKITLLYYFKLSLLKHVIEKIIRIMV